MKKFIATLMVVMIVFAMASGAVAAPTLYGTAQYVAWIDGTNFLRVETGNGYGIADMNGNMLTGTLYAKSFTREDTIITAAQLNVDELNYMGAFDLNASPVIPFQYGVIDVLNGYWAAAIKLEKTSAEQYDYSSYSGDYYLITGVDIYNLESKTCVASLTRSQYAEAYAIGNTINIADRTTGVITAYDAQFNVLGTGLKYTYSEDYVQPEIIIFRENGQKGLQDAAGNVIMEASFQMIYDFRYGYAIVSTGDHEGLIDEQGNVLVEPVFDTVKTMGNLPANAEGETYSYKALGYFCIQKDDKIGYVDENGNVTCEPKYSKSIVQINGVSLTYTDMEGKQHIMAADGVDTVIEGYDRVFALPYMSGAYYRVTDSDANYGMIDWHGNVVFPCEYDHISVSGDGQYVMVSKDYINYEIYKIDVPAAGASAAEAVEPIVENAADAAIESAASSNSDTLAAAQSALAALLGSAGNKETAAEAPAETAAPSVEEIPVTEEAAAEVVEEYALEAPAVDTASVKALLDSAKLILNADAAANKDGAISLITSASGMLAGSNATIATLLDTAVTMLNTDAAANGAAVVAILDSAASLL